MAPPPVVVRKATVADVPALTKVVNAAYRADDGGWTGEKEFIKGDRTSEAELTKQITEAKFFIYVGTLAGDAEVSGVKPGEIVGCFAVKPWKQGEAEIGMVSVAPKMQSKGLGTLLVASSYQFAKSEFNAQRAVVTVISVRQELLQWYEKLGFMDTGEKISKPGIDPLIQDFHFKLLQKEL